MLAFFDFATDYYVPHGGTVMRERQAIAIKGEWECDECGYIRVGTHGRPPKGECPDCGAPADETFTFYEYTEDENEDDGWDQYDDL